MKRPAKTQLEVVRDVLQSASVCDTWLTLDELRQLTRYGEASISAQLRNLRKKPYGAHVIDKRSRGDRVTEYKMRTGGR